jgi:hypothetical protein
MGALPIGDHEQHFNRNLECCGKAGTSANDAGDNNNPCATTATAAKSVGTTFLSTKSKSRAAAEGATRLFSNSSHLCGTQFELGAFHTRAHW